MPYAVILSLLRRFWPAIPIALLVVALLLTRHTLERTKTRLTAQVAITNQLVSDVKAKTAEAQAADLAHKATVEISQIHATQESDNALKSQLADARARADDLSRRLLAASQAHSSSSGTKDLSRPANAASGADGAGQATVVAADNIACAENTVKAQGWQDWWREVAAIPR